MKRSRLLVLLVLLAAVAVLPMMARAQAPQAGAQPVVDPVATALKNGFDGISRNLSESAVKMPEENFSFKPTPDVRSFGEILGHVASSHYSICSRAKGEKNPNTQNLEKVTTKAEMVKVFNESVDYCKAVYAAMTDAKIVQPVMPPAPATVPTAQGAQPPAAPRPVVPFSVLTMNLTHDWEHYGNLVTYLRLKGLVPPSTERSQMGRGRGGQD